MSRGKHGQRREVISRVQPVLDAAEALFAAALDRERSAGTDFEIVRRLGRARNETLNGLSYLAGFLGEAVESLDSPARLRDDLDAFEARLARLEAATGRLPSPDRRCVPPGAASAASSGRAAGQGRGNPPRNLGARHFGVAAMSLPIPPQKAHMVALFDAYVKASERALEFGPAYEPTLRQMDRRRITPADVTAVMQLIRHRIDNGLPGYSESSLGWKNAMFDVLKFEDRLAEIKAARARRAAKAERENAATAQPTRPAADEPSVDGKAVAEQLRKFREGGCKL